MSRRALPILIAVLATTTGCSLPGRMMRGYEAAFSGIEVFTRYVETAGGTPIEFQETRDITVREDILRLGAEARPADQVTVRVGLDRIGTGTVRPAAGVALDQAIGTMGARFTYTFAREPYGIGSAHYAGLQLTFNRR